MSTPTLYVFAISHYCEKARWALDHLGIRYALEHLAPGAHAARLQQQLGTAGTSVPVIADGDTVVQGSDAIFDWAEAHAAEGRTLVPNAPEAEWRPIEKRLDDVVGVHARRFYYSEAIVEHPDTVRPMFERGLVGEQRETLEKVWPMVPAVMAERMDLGAEQQKDSRRRLEESFDWLDGLLADGRRHLVGDRFSRVDVTAASLMAPLVAPPEHPTYADLQVPPRVAADLERWASRPVAEYVRRTYAEHR